MEMETKILVINPGSTSKKYGFFSGGSLKAQAYFEALKEGFKVNWQINNDSFSAAIDQTSFDKAREIFLNKLLETNHLTNLDELTACGIRVVSPGSFFLKNHKISTSVIEEMEKSVELAPLHLTPTLSELRSLMLSFPDLNVYAISDSQFHHSLPESAYLYGIDYNDSKTFDIRSFGYHGISVSSVIRKLKTTLGFLPEKVVVCHLGGGCSITAVKNGESVDTSMGFTPLDGLLMSTRPGDLDEGALLQLIKYKEFDYQDIENYLNKKSGLLGISQVTGDMKTLIELYEKNDINAKRAIDLYVYRLKKYIGAYASCLGGIDYLVFTATIGERAKLIRELVTKDLSFLGFEIDLEKNLDPVSHNGYISKFDSKKHLLVIPTNELEEMALQTQIVMSQT